MLKYDEKNRTTRVYRIIGLPCNIVNDYSIDWRKRSMTVVGSLLSFLSEVNLWTRSSKLSLFYLYICMYIYVAMQYIMLEARDNPVNQSAGSFFFSSRMNERRKNWLRICCSLTFSLFSFDNSYTINLSDVSSNLLVISK